MQNITEIREYSQGNIEDFKKSGFGKHNGIFKKCIHKYIYTIISLKKNGI